MEADKPHPSQDAMRAAYLASLGTEARADAERRSWSAWHFCADKANADELGALVVSGRKRATASSIRVYEAEGEPLPSPSDLSVITDWEGRALCVIETTDLRIVRFRDVGADFAAREGEGDGSLEYWKEGHRRYFSAEHEGLGIPFGEDVPVLCEDFRVVWPAEAARGHK